MTSHYDYDIVIAGGGMVGASLALLLSHHSGGRLNILVVESVKSSDIDTAKKPEYRPSFDARSSALAYGSRLILEPLGIWPQLAEHCTGIDSVHVCERGRPGSTLMTADEVKWPALGYVIENAWLGKVLLQALRQQNNIHFCSPASVSSLAAIADGVNVEVDHQQHNPERFCAQLAVVADGAHSALRRQLGIAVDTHDYQQSALIANVSFSKKHQGRAYERFTNQGPMALLPLADSEQGRPRAALIWTLPAADANKLRDCDEQQFLCQLQQCFGSRQGEFTQVGQRATYPLALIQTHEQVRSSIVVMGNAAHALHPVAGQGFNLALRDCARLSAIIAERSHRQDALGDLTALNHYFHQQQFDQQKTIGFSDYLPSVFSHRFCGAGIMRSVALATLDVLPSVKRHFLHHAAGLHDGAALNY